MRDRIAGTRAFGQPIRYILQKFVADRMPQRVVDTLESIKVHKQNCEHFVFALGDRDCSFEALAEQLAVGKLGELVVVGEVINLCFCAFAFSDVANDCQHRILVARHKASFKMNVETVEYMFVDLRLAGLKCTLDTFQRAIVIFARVKVNL